MKLRDVHLTLFRQHRESHVSFPDGLTAVIGPNGAGKSTLVEAISFALFGTQAIRGKIDTIRTRNDDTKRKGDPEVKLVIEHDGVVFTIERSPSNAALYVAGEARAIAEGNRDVTSRVSSIIGMSYEEFVATYCTEQKGLEFLSGKRGTTEREKFIIRMMGFDRLEDVQEKLRADRKDKRNELIGFEASLGNREALLTQLMNEKHQLSIVNSQHEEAKKIVFSTEIDHDTRKKRMEILEELKSRYSKLADQEKTIQVRMDEKRKRRFAIERDLPEEMRLHTDRSEWIAVQLNNVRGAQKEHLDKEGALSSEEAGLRSKLEIAEQKWRESITEARIAAEHISFQIKELQNKKNKYSALGGASECPTCGQTLSSGWHQHEADIEKKITALDADLREKRSVLSSVEALPAVVGDIREAIISGQKAAMAEREVLADLRKKESELARFERAAEELERIVAEEQEISKELDALKKKIVDLRFSEQEYLGEKGGFETVQRLLEVARLQRMKLDGELRTREALVLRTESEISRHDEKLSLLEAAKRDLQLLDGSDVVLTEFRRYLNTGIRPRLAELASEYLADLTDGRYVTVDLGPDFTPTVIDGGEPKPVISGGEEDILNLCMRLALSHMIADRAGQAFSLLILDEVFGSLDEGRRNNVLDLLEKLSRRFDQILIITHLDDVKEGVRSAVFVDYEEETGTARISDGGGAEELLAVNI